MLKALINALWANLKQMIAPSFSARDSDSRFCFLEIGFHGERYLLQLADWILHSCSVLEQTSVSPLPTLPANIPVSSASHANLTYRHSSMRRETQGHLSNVHVFNETSQKFLDRIQRDYSCLLREDVLFWLDAHGYGFEWPFRDEIACITRKFKMAYILIDDFKVPRLDYFGYDAYQDQECSFEYIRGAL